MSEVGESTLQSSNELPVLVLVFGLVLVLVLVWLVAVDLGGGAPETVADSTRNQAFVIGRYRLAVEDVFRVGRVGRNQVIIQVALGPVLDGHVAHRSRLERGHGRYSTSQGHFFRGGHHRMRHQLSETRARFPCFVAIDHIGIRVEAQRRPGLIKAWRRNRGVESQRQKLQQAVDGKRRVFPRRSERAAKSSIESHHQRVSPVGIHHFHVVEIGVFVGEDLGGGIQRGRNTVLVFEKLPQQRDRRVVSTTTRPIDITTATPWLFCDFRSGLNILHRPLKNRFCRVLGSGKLFLGHFRHWQIHRRR